MPSVRKSYDEELLQLDTLLARMGHEAGAAIESALTALRNDDIELARSVVAALEAQQQPLQRCVGEGHQHGIQRGHTHRKIAGVEHGGLRQQHAGGVDDAQHNIELDRELDLVPSLAGDDVLVLVEAEERDDVGHQNQAERLQPVGMGIVQQQVKPVGDEPGHGCADGQRHQIGQKHISIL